MPKERNYYRFEVKYQRKVVMYGISENPKHEILSFNDKIFTHYNIIGPAVTKDSAENWLDKKLKMYRRGHGGYNPEYNRTDTVDLKPNAEMIETQPFIVDSNIKEEPIYGLKIKITGMDWNRVQSMFKTIKEQVKDYPDLDGTGHATEPNENGEFESDFFFN